MIIFGISKKKKKKKKTSDFHGVINIGLYIIKLKNKVKINEEAIVDFFKIPSKRSYIFNKIAKNFCLFYHFIWLRLLRIENVEFFSELTNLEHSTHKFLHTDIFQCYCQFHWIFEVSNRSNW